MDTKDTLHTYPQEIPAKNGLPLVYRLRKGRKDCPTLVFLGGYRSDMMGSKACYLDAFCARHDIPYLRFDYSGHGESGGRFEDGCIGTWRDDALSVITAATDGDLILVGSSMGGWIGLLVAQVLPDRIKGFIGIAAAPDFTDWVWNDQMTAAQRSLCAQQGFIETPDGGYFTQRLFTDGTSHLIFDKPLYLPHPVTLLQGEQDSQVPVTIAQKLAAHITPHPAELILIPDGDHRLSRDQDLDILGHIILNFYKNTPSSD